MNASRKKARADVTRRPGRTVLVVLGIFIGVFGLTAINFTEDSIFNAFAFSVSGAQPSVIVTVDRLDTSLVSPLQAVANVQAVQYQTGWQTAWHISQAPGHAQMAIDSYPDIAHTVLVGVQVTSGRYPTAPGEILMEYGDQGIQPVAIGDAVTVETPGGTAQLHVVGLARTPGVNPAASGRALGYMTDAGLAQLASTTQATTNAGGAALIYNILVKVGSLGQEQAAVTALQRVLSTHSVAVLNTTFPGHTDPATLQAISSVFALLRILVVVAVVMSGILILNTITTLIAEQTAIIGTMKALGGTQGQIMRGYLGSVLLYSVLGTVPATALGIVGGYGLAAALAGTIPLDIGPFALTPEVIPFGLAVGFGVPLVAALLPLWNGTRITVREALAAYGVSAGAETRQKGRALGWLPPTMALGLRGAFRKRWRVALTVLTITVAGVCFLTVQTAVTSVNATVGDVYGRFGADVMADMEPTGFADLRTAMSGVTNIARMERFAEGGSDTTWGHLELWGFDADTQLYHYQLTSGRWLRPGDTTVLLLSDDAAAKSGLHIGDTLNVNNRGGTSVWTIIGTVKQPTSNIGGLGSGITTTEALYQLEGIISTDGTTPQSPPDVVQRIMVRAQDRSASAVAQLTTDIDGALNRGGPKISPTGLKSIGGEAYTVASEALRHQQSWYVLYDLLYAVALVVGAAGILGLANALVASVLERRREIGMLRALGATGWRVAGVFWTEGLTLGGLSWLLAALLGIPFAYGFVQLLRQVVIPTEFTLDATAFAVMLVAIALIASLASLAPAGRAARMRISEILLYE